MSSSTAFDPLNPPSLKTRRSISPLGCIAILFGCLFLAIVIVGMIGAFAWTRSLQQAGKARLENSQWQLLQGRPIDQSIKQSIGSAGIMRPDDPELAEIQQLVSGGTANPLPIDLSRFIQAIEQSNAAEIDWPTRLVMKQQVSEEYLTTIWPTIQNKVLHAEWIKQNQEARVFVLSDSSFTNSRSIYALWLIRSDETWKVYDSKDVLESLSQADYLANAYGLMDGNSLYRFQEAIGKMDNARQIAAYAASTRVEKPFSDMALTYALRSLEDFRAWDEMEQLASRIDTQNCKYAWLYLAKIAAQKKNYEQVVMYYRKLFDEFGWFPGLPQLLGAWKPTNAEDQLLVRQCLVKELATLEYNDELKNQIELDAPELMSAIVQFIQAIPDKNAFAERLFTKGALANQRSIQQMLDSVSGQEAFDSARPQLEGLLAYHQQQWDLSANLLQDAINGRLREQTSVEYNPLLRLFVESVLKCNDPVKHCQAITEKQKLVDFLLSYFLTDSSTAPRPNQQLTQLMDWIEAEQLKIERPCLVPLIRAITLKEIEPDRSMKLALQIHQQIVDELSRLGVFEQQLTLTRVETEFEHTSPISVAPVLYSLISELMSDDEAWRKYRAELNTPDVAFLLKAKQCKLPCRHEEMSEAIQWYESEIDSQGDPWLSFFKSRIAFCQGNWENADDHLQQTIAFVGDDNYSDTLASRWYWSETPHLFAPELNSIRATTALRCGRLEDYLGRVFKAANTQEAEESWTRVLSRIESLSNIEFPILLPDLANVKSQVPQDNEALKRFFDNLEFNRLVAKGDYPGAWQLGLALIEESDDESPDENTLQLLDVGLASGRLEELDLSNLDLEHRKAFNVLAALTKKDVDMFRTALESFTAGRDGLFEMELQMMPNAKVAILDNGWDSILAQHGMVLYPESQQASLSLIPFDDHRSTGEVVDAISSVLLQFDSAAISMDASTIDHCVAAWRLSEGQPSAALYLLNQDASRELGKSNSCWPATNWTLAIQMPNSGGPTTTKPPAVLAVAKSLIGVRGFWESSCEIFVPQPNWETIGEATLPYQLIDPLSPAPLQLWRESTRKTINELAAGDEVCLEVICNGVVSEALRVRVISDLDENDYTEIELLESSILIPKLTTGRRISKWIFDLSNPSQPDPAAAGY